MCVWLISGLWQQEVLEVFRPEVWPLDHHEKHDCWGVCCGLFIGCASAAVTMLQMKLFRERDACDKWGWTTAVQWGLYSIRREFYPQLHTDPRSKPATALTARGDFTTLKQQQWNREIRMLFYRCSVWVWSCPSHISWFLSLVFNIEKKRGVRLQYQCRSLCFTGWFSHNKKRFGLWGCV